MWNGPVSKRCRADSPKWKTPRYHKSFVTFGLGEFCHMLPRVLAGIPGQSQQRGKHAGFGCGVKTGTAWCPDRRGQSWTWKWKKKVLTGQKLILIWPNAKGGLGNFGQAPKLWSPRKKDTGGQSWCVEQQQADRQQWRRQRKLPLSCAAEAPNCLSYLNRVGKAWARWRNEAQRRDEYWFLRSGTWKYI